MDKKMVVLAGVAVTIIGLFLPIITLPIVGSVNLLLPGGGIGDGIFVLVLAVVAAALALLGHVKHAVWPAIGTLGFLAYKYFELKGVVDQAGAAATPPAGMELPPEIAAQVAAAMPTMNMLGWGVLGLGAVIMLVGAAMAWKSNPPAAA